MSLEILTGDNLPKSAQFIPFRIQAIAKPVAEVGKMRPLQGLATQFKANTQIGTRRSYLGQKERPDFVVICFWNRIGPDADAQKLF